MRYYSSVAGAPTITAPLTDSATSFVVTSVTGFPSSTPFTLVLDPGLATEEIVTCTGVAGTTLSVTRGEDGSSAQAHSTGSVVRHMGTARDLREPQEHINASEEVHGLAAGVAVVGTTKAQTLTGKTMSGSLNTFSDIPASAVTGLAAHTAATSGVHGTTGTVVGTSDTQTLTNKTISGASNTLSNIAQSSVTNLVSDLAAKAASSTVSTLSSTVSTIGTDLDTAEAAIDALEALNVSASTTNELYGTYAGQQLAVESGSVTYNTDASSIGVVTLPAGFSNGLKGCVFSSMESTYTQIRVLSASGPNTVSIVVRRYDGTGSGAQTGLEAQFFAQGW